VWALFLLTVNVLGAFVWKFRYERNNCIKNYDELIKKLNKIAGELASIRVKHGQTWETFLPLMATFEKTLGPKENATFLGQPIDLIYFNDTEIIFVEVKTGNSRLSGRQRHIRNLVKDRKVRWEEVNDSLKYVLPDTDRISSVDMLKTIPHRKLSDEPSEEKSND
jgi:predicted Holliday junction resolvase-like endonuclease